jgi:hypothetical protein
MSSIKNLYPKKIEEQRRKLDERDANEALEKIKRLSLKNF